MKFDIEPIGYFYSSATAPYDLPRQPGLLKGNKGVIRLNEGCQFEQALDGLGGFDLIWVVFCFHRSAKWKPKVLPPRGRKKQGVFATRSPHRPNFIGLSCVKLEAVEGLTLMIVQHDLLDGTPILDLKPYLNYADSQTAACQGWLDELPTQPEEICFQWSSRAQAQLDYLATVWNFPLQAAIEHRLTQSPVPYPNHRVKQISTNVYELAYRTWRICYAWNGDVVSIQHIKSGYNQETLAGKQTSRWDDVSMHQAFVRYCEEQA